MARNPKSAEPADIQRSQEDATEVSHYTLYCCIIFPCDFLCSAIVYAVTGLVLSLIFPSSAMTTRPHPPACHRIRANARNSHKIVAVAVYLVILLAIPAKHAAAVASAIETAGGPLKVVSSTADFDRIGLPFSIFGDRAARLTGVATVSLPAISSRPAFVFAGGRHSLSGQGWLLFQDDPSPGKIPAAPSFGVTQAIAFGPNGGYNGVSVTKSTISEPQHQVVLLAGGVCQSCSSSTCYNGAPRCRNRRTPARMFTIDTAGKDINSTRITEVWREPAATKNRAAALARLPGDGTLTPTVFVAGEGGLDVWRSSSSSSSSGSSTASDAAVYNKVFHLDVPRRSDSSSRYVGMDAKIITGGTTSASPTSLLVALGGRGSGPSASLLNFSPLKIPPASLPAPQNLILQPAGAADFEVAGVVVGDLLAPLLPPLDGDSAANDESAAATRTDVVVANGANAAQQAYIYSFNRNPDTGVLFNPVVTSLGTKRINGRAVVTGNFFSRPSGSKVLPDIAIATTTGTIELFANDSTDLILRFSYRGLLSARTRSEGYEIRGLATFRNPGANLDAIVATAYNPGRSKNRAGCANVPAAPERADQALSSWQCHNAFVFYAR
jgi:hypothetical protein